MKKNRKNEEGAVLLLLIVMMSAVVLIVASLLRFNTQNIKFAAIEAEQEKALYLAEGVADAVDFYLMEELALLSSYDNNDITPLLNECRDSEENAHMQWISNIDPGDGTDDKVFFQFPSIETFLGETIINDVTIKVYDSRGEDQSFLVEEVKDNHNILLGYSAIAYVEVIGDDASRKIEITFYIPLNSELENTSTLIKSKNLNYSNSL